MASTLDLVTRILTVDTRSRLAPNDLTNAGRFFSRAYDTGLSGRFEFTDIGRNGPIQRAIGTRDTEPGTIGNFEVVHPTPNGQIGNGAGLFDGVVSFAPRCRACQLDFAAFNVGDGPVAFLTLGVGALVAALAIMLELGATPPWWVHVLLWVPLTAALVLAGLRFAKGLLLTLEYRRGAREARSGKP